MLCLASHLNLALLFCFSNIALAVIIITFLCVVGTFWYLNQLAKSWKYLILSSQQKKPHLMRFVAEVHFSFWTELCLLASKLYYCCLLANLGFRVRVNKFSVGFHRNIHDYKTGKSYIFRVSHLLCIFFSS